MTAHPADPADVSSELIGRCYTKARRAPLVHGVIRDINGGKGLRLPGGPYTLTQLTVIVTTFVLLILTRSAWGGHGLMDVVVLLGLPFAGAFLLRHVHIDGRNPAAALVSVAVMVTGPRWGRLNGRTFRPARPGKGSNTLITLDLDTDTVPARTVSTTVRPPAPAPTRPAAAAAVSPAAGATVASGVQALLARHTTAATSGEN